MLLKKKTTAVAFTAVLNCCCLVLLTQPKQRLFELRDLKIGMLPLLNFVVEGAVTATGRHQAGAYAHQLL